MGTLKQKKMLGLGYVHLLCIGSKNYLHIIREYMYTIAHARIHGGGERGPDSPMKNHKSIGFLSNPEKSQSYQASIQCWAIIGPPGKRHLNDGPF